MVEIEITEVEIDEEKVTTPIVELTFRVGSDHTLQITLNLEELIVLENAAKQAQRALISMMKKKNRMNL